MFTELYTLDRYDIADIREIIHFDSWSQCDSNIDCLIDILYIATAMNGDRSKPPYSVWFLPSVGMTS